MVSLAQDESFSTDMHFFVRPQNKVFMFFNVPPYFSIIGHQILHVALYLTP